MTGVVIDWRVRHICGEAPHAHVQTLTAGRFIVGR